jgi:hypothetical protein
MGTEPSGNGVEGNQNGEPGESTPDKHLIASAVSVDSKQAVPTVDPIGTHPVARTETEQPSVHKQQRNKNLTPEPKDPNSGRMTFLTAIIAVATVINIGVFWYESEDSSQKIRVLSEKAGGIVNSMNTALLDNQVAISKAFAANQKAVEAGERQSKSALDASIKAAQINQRAWIGVSRVAMRVAQGQPVEWEVFHNNSGNTPALTQSIHSRAIGIIRNRGTGGSAGPWMPK